MNIFDPPRETMPRERLARIQLERAQALLARAPPQTEANSAMLCAYQ